MGDAIYIRMTKHGVLLLGIEKVRRTEVKYMSIYYSPQNSPNLR